MVPVISIKSEYVVTYLAFVVSMLWKVLFPFFKLIFVFEGPSKAG